MMFQKLQDQIKEFFREDNIVSIEEELKAIRQRNEARAKAASTKAASTVGSGGAAATTSGNRLPFRIATRRTWTT